MLGTGFGKEPTEEIACKNCKAINYKEATHCFACGSPLKTKEVLKEDPRTEVKIAPVEKQKTISHYIEPDAIFASGLPAWDIVPPEIVVRRRRSI